MSSSPSLSISTSCRSGSELTSKSDSRLEENVTTSKLSMTSPSRLVYWVQIT